MATIFISTYPFSHIDKAPLRLLNESGIDYAVNSRNRKLTPAEISDSAKDCEAIIAGTEDLNLLIDSSVTLKMISRVGIGLDSVPLHKCKEKSIAVAYTPDAVTTAVAEFTIGLMLTKLRHISFADRQIRQGQWQRPQGKRVQLSTIGIIGLGRVGANVIRLLSSLKPKLILVNDIKDKENEVLKLISETKLDIKIADKEQIYRESDIISLHIPKNKNNLNLINEETFKIVNRDAFIINTSRGGLINEEDLCCALEQDKILGAAIDVFNQEPYNGPLTNLENALLTQHMASCSYDCRSRMEIEATTDAINFLQNKPILNPVPEEEYFNQL